MIDLFKFFRKPVTQVTPVSPLPVQPVAPVVVAPRSPYSSRFEACMPLIFQHEGGLVNDPQDPGGITNYGISLRAAKGFGSLADVDKDGDVDANDIKKMTKEDAKRIYWSQYWTTVRADEMPAGIDLSVFDFGVNAGPSRAIETLQLAINDVLGQKTVNVDRMLGPKTLANTARADQTRLVEAYARRRENFYRSLSGFARFGRGWLSRNNGTKDASLSAIMR